MTNHTALGRFLETSAFDACDARLVTAIASAALHVSRAVVVTEREPAGDEPSATLRNVQGEVIHAREIAASDAFVSELSKEPCCGGLLGKSFGVPLDFRSHSPERFVCFNALDNPAQLAAGGPTGATFGIAPWSGSASASALLAGRELLAAGFFLYAEPLTLVLASPKRVDLFEWSETAGDFVLARADLRCPVRGDSYSVDVPRVGKWYPSARDWLSRLTSGELFSGRKYDLYDSGALVSDAHRALVEGGVYVHPADSESDGGDLRLINEGNPLAFVFRAASGRATTGAESPLEVRPTSYSQSTPFVAGSRDEVESFERRSAVSRGLHRRPA
jgi:fructose-1,6-bisphosphatase I